MKALLHGTESRLSFGMTLWSFIFPGISFALPAWAVTATGMFSEYAPLSWVAAGFAGLLIFTIAVALYGYGRQKMVRSKYDERFFQTTGGADPMAKVFQDKRIMLNDFILPSLGMVDGKTFVNCEIVGPANLYLAIGNNINDVKPLTVDAVALNGVKQFYNGYIFSNCTFRGCTFHRITLFIQPQEFKQIKHLEWLNWISFDPEQEKPLAVGGGFTHLIEGQPLQPQKDTAGEMPL